MNETENPQRPGFGLTGQQKTNHLSWFSYL